MSKVYLVREQGLTPRNVFNMEEITFVKGFGKDSLTNTVAEEWKSIGSHRMNFTMDTSQKR